jgi:toxin ParE1/3/4
MPETQVVFHRLAGREYRSARDWYAARSAEVAGRFRDAVDRAVQRIAKDPEALARLGTAYRWVRVNRFPYVLVFREKSPGLIMVVAVAHTSRRPGYWRRRH